MKGYLICPVRGHDPSETADIVAGLELRGWDIHWPHRDTDQSDDIGLQICAQNMNAIADADMIFLVLDNDSRGSFFDMGMAWALGKPLTIIDAPPPESSSKSFTKMIRAWEKLGRGGEIR